jgi:hypothetical protein
VFAIIVVFRTRTDSCVWSEHQWSQFREDHYNRLANGSSILHLHLIVDYTKKLCFSRLQQCSLICSGTTTVWTLIIGSYDFRIDLIYSLHALVTNFAFVCMHSLHEAPNLRNYATKRISVAIASEGLPRKPWREFTLCLCSSFLTRSSSVTIVSFLEK